MAKLLGLLVLRVLLPVADGLKAFPVGHRNAQTRSGGFYAQVAWLLGCQFRPPLGHFGVAVIAVCAMVAEDDGVVGGLGDF